MLEFDVRAKSRYNNLKSQRLEDNRVKKYGAILMALVIILSLTGCGSRSDTAGAPSPTPAADASPSPLPDAPVSGNGLTDPLDQLPGDDALPDGKLPGDAGADDLSGLMESDEDDPMDEPSGTPGTAKPTGTPAAGKPAQATPPPSADASAKSVKIEDYVLEPYADEDLHISLDYPSHWTVETSENTLRFTEPVSGNAEPMRLTLTVKNYDQEKMTSQEMKKLFADYMDALKSDYDGIKKGKPNGKAPFINRKALSATYMAKQGKATLKGFVIMAAIEESKQVVALRFTAPQAKFKPARSFFKKVMYSVAPVKAQ